MTDSSHTPTTSSAPVAESSGAEAVKTRPGKPKRQHMPRWKVLLHNDDQNEMGYVVNTILQLTPLNSHQALVCMLEAHRKGLSLLTTTHREHAELMREQFQSKFLKVTIEPE